MLAFGRTLIYVVEVEVVEVEISRESRMGYRILEDGHVVFVVEVLVETQHNVLSVRISEMGAQEV